MVEFGNWKGFFCSKLIEKCKKMSGLFEKHWRVRACGAASSRFLRDSGSRALASNICHNSQRANSSVFLSCSAPPVKFISCVAESMPLSSICGRWHTLSIAFRTLCTRLCELILAATNFEMKQLYLIIQKLLFVKTKS
jgi:hypothetical protein